MRTSRLQMLLNGATYLLLAVAFNYGPAVMDDAGKLLVLLILACLLLFVIRSSVVRNLFQQCFAVLTAWMQTDASGESLWRPTVDAASPESPSLPCRFQRPPPVFAL